MSMQCAACTTEAALGTGGALRDRNRPVPSQREVNPRGFACRRLDPDGGCLGAAQNRTESGQARFQRSSSGDWGVSEAMCPE